MGQALGNLVPAETVYPTREIGVCLFEGTLLKSGLKGSQKVHPVFRDTKSGSVSVGARVV